MIASLIFEAGANEASPLDMNVLAQNWNNPKVLIDRPEVRPKVDEIKKSLHLGSDEELIAIAKSVNPEIVKKIAELNIELTPEKIAKLEKLAVDNKSALIATLLTGKVSSGLMAQIEVIVPELKKLDGKTKQQVFNSVGETAGRLVFDGLARTEVLLGYLKGDKESYGIAQLNGRILNFRKITFGDIELSNVHVSITTGYPQNSITLLNGTVGLKGSKFSYEGALLGISHNIAEEKLEINLARARINYSILPWLNAYTGIGFGVKSTAQTIMTVEPKLGLEASAKKGRLTASAFVEGTYKLTEGRALVSCGGTLGFSVVDKDFIKVNTGIMSQLNIETNAGSGNTVESINGFGISGRF